MGLQALSPDNLLSTHDVRLRFLEETSQGRL